jgi:hypothetical protein
MARPRVFVSSTYYDLRYIREGLEKFISTFGYEPVLFESGDIPFRHDIPLDKSCYAEIQSSHMLVLIIGSRYGSPTSEERASRRDEINKTYEFYNSITKEEYVTARERDIPIFIFVEKNVLSEYETYKRNRDGTVSYAHVDNINVFKLLDEIISQSRNNFVRPFDKFEDISEWLTEQWAGLFADSLSRRTSDATLKDLASRVAELGQVSATLKEYTELIIRTLKPTESGEIISKQEQKLERSRIEQFEKEGLVDYLARKIGVFQPRPDTDALYNAFRNARGLEDVLSYLGVSPSQHASVLRGVERPAAMDFAQIKSRFFGDRIDESAELTRVQRLTGEGRSSVEMIDGEPEFKPKPKTSALRASAAKRKKPAKKRAARNVSVTGTEKKQEKTGEAE